MNEIKILIVDDEDELRRSLSSILVNSLPKYSLTLHEASNGKMAASMVKANEYDLVFMDVRMPELDGLQALKIIKGENPKTFVVIMTAHSNLKDAVEAIRCGAYDYVEKPIQPDQLTTIVSKALETQEMVSSLAFSKPLMDDDIETEFVGVSQKMTEVFDLINRLSHVDTTVLIRGENGTGKELVAKAIHFNSPRKHGEFVAINCAAIPNGLLESELFGHERGAFTDAVERKIGKFQLANKGTLFLDEIAELNPEMQVKLLRILQDQRFTPVGGNREVKTNARIIAATNRNLEKMLEDGSFREDLFYRINVMPIFMPPLRDRVEDLESLVDYFIKKFSSTSSRIQGIESAAVTLLKRYPWPGNIRELENVIERAMIVENSTMITVASLPDGVKDYVADNVNMHFSQDYVGPMDFDEFKEWTEKEFIVNALKVNKGKINQTVAQANIPKNTLLRKIRKYQINVKDL